jgi:hypothetical protein
VIGPQHDTGRVTEVFTGAQPWLLADHPVAIDMLDATIGIGDAPVAVDQACGDPPLVVDADRVGERKRPSSGRIDRRERGATSTEMA